MARRVAKKQLPPNSVWKLQAVLCTGDGTEIGRTVELQWSAAWARDTHQGHHGLAVKGLMNDVLIRLGYKPGTML